MQAPKLYTNECQKHGIQLLNNSASAWHYIKVSPVQVYHTTASKWQLIGPQTPITLSLAFLSLVMVYVHVYWGQHVP